MNCQNTDDTGNDEIRLTLRHEDTEGNGEITCLSRFLLVAAAMRNDLPGEDFFYRLASSVSRPFYKRARDRRTMGGSEHKVYTF